MNSVILIGRMTRDPELRRTANGDAVTSFTLAVDRGFKNQAGESMTDFINCVVWKKTAENVEQYCFKGSLVAVEGRLQSRQYDAQDGSKRTVIEVVCNMVQFLDTKSNTDKTSKEKTSINDDFYDNNSTFDIKDDDIQF